MADGIWRMTTYLSALNLIQWLAPRAGVRGESHPQQAARNVSRTAGRFHSNEPEPLRPERWKCFPGSNNPAMRKR